MNKENNVIVLHPTNVPDNGDDGGDRGIERLTGLEEKVYHLATNTQLQEVNTNIEKVRSDLEVSIEKVRSDLRILKWISGIVVLGIIFINLKIYS